MYDIMYSVCSTVYFIKDIMYSVCSTVLFVVQSPRFKSFGSSRNSLNPTLRPNLRPNKYIDQERPTQIYANCVLYTVGGM